MFLFLACFVCISFFVLNSYTLDPRTTEAYNIIPNAECTISGQTLPCYKGQFDFQMASYTVLAWLGACVFSIMGGVGLVVVPYELLEMYIYRPKKIPQDKFTFRRRVLLPRIVKLRETGKKLEDQRLLVADMKGWQGFVKRY